MRKSDHCRERRTCTRFPETTPIEEQGVVLASIIFAAILWIGAIVMPPTDMANKSAGSLAAQFAKRDCDRWLRCKN